MSKEILNGRPIQRVLRRKDSRKYFTGNGWTDNVEDARIFADSLEAARVCAEHCLWDVEMVLRVKGGTTELYRADVR